MTTYAVSCWERNSGFRYCRDYTTRSKRQAMSRAVVLASETAGDTGYDVAVERMDTPVGFAPAIIARWRNGRRITVEEAQP